MLNTLVVFKTVCFAYFQCALVLLRTHATHGDPLERSDGEISQFGRVPAYLQIELV